MMLSSSFREAQIVSRTCMPTKGPYPKRVNVVVYLLMAFLVCRFKALLRQVSLSPAASAETKSDWYPGKTMKVTQVSISASPFSVWPRRSLFWLAATSAKRSHGPFGHRRSHRRSNWGSPVTRVWRVSNGIGSCFLLHI